MQGIKLHSGGELPLEMHKVRMVQKLNLLPVDERARSMAEAGYNTFLLKNRDVFLDMLTDSGSNAMSDRQYAAMLVADDSYAGSETYYRLEEALFKLFGKKYFLPTHQGRACEHIIARTMVKPGSVAIMNYHFTTTKAHITAMGGSVLEILTDDGVKITSNCMFKGNIDIDKLNAAIKEQSGNISFVRIEAGTNLIGGQPVSVANMREVSAICKKAGIKTVFDASLLADNLYFVAIREKEFEDVSLQKITLEMASLFDVVYFSARKLGCARGGGILTDDDELHLRMRELIPLYEGFLTYGGMSVKEMEALAVGLDETLDINAISQTPVFVKALADELILKGVPVVTPAGGLGCHIDARAFCDHIANDK